MKKTLRRDKQRQLYALLQKPGEKTPTQIAKDLGIHVATFYRWKELFIEQVPQLKQSAHVVPMRRGDDIKPEVSTIEKFKEIPTVTSYVANQEINKSFHFINHLFKICNASNTHPDKLSESLESAKQSYLEFEALFRQDNPNVTTENYRKAMRKFLTYSGITIPARDKILSGSTDSKGDYARVYLSLPEINTVSKRVGEEAGSEYRDLFLIHHEVFARPKTMLHWRPTLEVRNADVDGQSYEFGETSMFEKKQNKHYDKIVIEPTALKLLSDYSGKRIVEDDDDVYEKKYARALRAAYNEIGKMDNGFDYQKGEEGWLYKNRPIYCIRHSSAVTWLYRTAFDASLVARMGWEKVDTLTQFYARTTASNMMQKGVCYYCNPPNVKQSLPLFCSPLHSLAWFNNGRKSK